MDESGTCGHHYSELRTSGIGYDPLATQLARDRPALRLGKDDWMVPLFGSSAERGETEHQAITQVQHRCTPREVLSVVTLLL
jgi:predicted kinase